MEHGGDVAGGVGASVWINWIAFPRHGLAGRNGLLQLVECPSQHQAQGSTFAHEFDGPIEVSEGARLRRMDGELQAQLVVGGRRALRSCCGRGQPFP